MTFRLEENSPFGRCEGCHGYYDVGETVWVTIGLFHKENIRLESIEDGFIARGKTYHVGESLETNNGTAIALSASTPRRKR